jgi:hypothetical protein
MALAEHRFKIRYTGGPADQHSLPAYDGAKSMDGIVRAISIATHAYMTGEVVSRATALRNASLLIKPARQGSFVFEIVALIEAYPAMSSVTAALLSAPFYDFVKVAFKRATGSIAAEPESSHLRKLYTRRDPPPLRRPADLDELGEMLEGSLQDAHRPIGDNDTVRTIELSTPRSNLIIFDNETKDWVNTRQEDAPLTEYTGNITRYNSISRNARCFVEQLERVVPVKPDADFNSANLGFLTWSLHGSNVGAAKKLMFRAKTIKSASGKVKRLSIVDCQRAPQD